MIDPLLEIGPHVTAIPIVYGSGDFAWEVRRIMATHEIDCLAVPLPMSFQPLVERAILEFPAPSVVLQRNFGVVGDPWPVDDVADEGERRIDLEDVEWGASYVPIDPCQGVIAAIRAAMGDRLPRYFIDLETSDYLTWGRTMPDAFALKRVPIEKYAAAVLPHLERPQFSQWEKRMAHMAWRLRELSVDYQKILLVISVLDWPWVRQAFLSPRLQRYAHEPTFDCEFFGVQRDTLYFFLGELPFITDLYERARANLGDDARLSIDGVKELLVSARESYSLQFGNRARKITPRTLATILKYIRNLTLIEHRFSPQLLTIALAAKQIVGDGYALCVLEKAKQYSYVGNPDRAEIKFGIEEASFPGGLILPMANRLPGPQLVWSQLELIPQPDVRSQAEWQQRWNPFSQCSWPPEDVLIEQFRQTVFSRALETMGADLAKTEKFTTSVKDGIDVRDTIRHWHEGDIYVKTLPPNRGKLDCAVMLFDSPADPRDYPWRTTWFAEHKDESTLCFFGSDYMQQPVGPGICLATYGGVMFLYPPVMIPDIWTDTRLDFASTLEERLLAAACVHSSCPTIALLSTEAPGLAWRQLAKSFGKKWVHLPLSRFSDSTVQQLRMVHVLNDKEIRSYAANFIRRA